MESLRLPRPDQSHGHGKNTGPTGLFKTVNAPGIIPVTQRGESVRRKATYADFTCLTLRIKFPISALSGGVKIFSDAPPGCRCH